MMQQAARQHFDQANALAAQSKYQAAFDEYTQAIRLAPSCDEIHSARLDLLTDMVMEDIVETSAIIHACDEWLRVNPDAEDAHFNRGNWSDDFEQAVADLTKAIERAEAGGRHPWSMYSARASKYKEWGRATGDKEKLRLAKADEKMVRSHKSPIVSTMARIFNWLDFRSPKMFCLLCLPTILCVSGCGNMSMDNSWFCFCCGAPLIILFVVVGLPWLGSKGLLGGGRPVVWGRCSRCGGPIYENTRRCASCGLRH